MMNKILKKEQEPSPNKTPSLSEASPEALRRFIQRIQTKTSITIDEIWGEILDQISSCKERDLMIYISGMKKLSSLELELIKIKLKIIEWKLIKHDEAPNNCLHIKKNP